MKKLLVVLLLVTAVYAMAQDQPAAAAQPAPQKKVIQDSAEYNAYVAAIGAKPGAEREAALEAFLTSYPKTIMKEDALEALLGDYQGTGPLPKFSDAGKRLMEVNPNNLKGLALISYVDRAVAVQSGANDKLVEAGELANRGMGLLPTAPKPEGVADADWAKTKEAYKAIFLPIIGHGAFAKQDYATAQTNLKLAVAATPTDINLIYLLARSYLDPKPPVVDGLFWIARAIALAPAGPEKDKTVAWAKRKYFNYHGGDDGFDQLVADAAKAATIPAGFTVKPAPSPAEMAADMIKKPFAQLSFGEWEFIMTSGNQAASDEVWNTIKGKNVHLQGWVIEATSKEVKIAGTPDANEENPKRTEINLTLTTALLAKQVPKPGTAIKFAGVPDSFTATPFLITMIDGQLDLPEAPKAKPSPAHHPPAKKK